MSDWRPIETAPTDRWIYLWEADVARYRVGMTGWELDLDGPYIPRIGRWDGERWFVENDGSRVKGATHWRELFDPPEAKS